MALPDPYAALLAASGFLSLTIGRRDRAEKIFNALAERWPERLAPLLGRCLGLILADEAEKAIVLMEKEGAAHRNEPAWGGFHALALAEAGRTGAAREELTGLLARDPDHPDKAMAKALLAHLEA
jgi:thioredoxin-like negative regulator of GroEL